MLLKRFLEDSDLDLLKSGFGQGHRPDRMLVLLHDLQQSQDNCRTILVLFGLSMAFHTVDPSIFLDHPVGVRTQCYEDCPPPVLRTVLQCYEDCHIQSVCQWGGGGD